MDAKTEELRAAHDVLAEFYAERLADALDHMPVDRAVLGLFCGVTLAADLGTSVGDVGCGTGRLEPYLAARGLSPRGVDLSPEMIRVARRDHPGFDFDIADLRELPFEDASLAGVVCWYSLMYLAPCDRPAGFSELARVVKPEGYLVTAFKAGDSQVRRGGRGTGLGVEFDVYWLSPDEMERRVSDAGFATVFCGEVLPKDGRVPRRGICSLGGHEAHSFLVGEHPHPGRSACRRTVFPREAGRRGGSGRNLAHAGNSARRTLRIGGRGARYRSRAQC